MRKNRVITCVIVIAILLVVGAGIYTALHKDSSEERKVI